MSISIYTLVIGLFFLFSGAALGQTQVPNTFQAGQPASAAEVNANFSELESAVNKNANDTSDHEQRLDRVENDLDLVLDRVIPCSDYKLYGCTRSTSANGTTFTRAGFNGRFQVAAYLDETALVLSDSVFFAISADGADFTNLWIGGSANLTRNLAGEFSPALVDDCDNPTIQLVPTGDPASSRLVTNNGNFYRHMNTPIIETVDVTGQTFGLINQQTPGNIIESCTLVNDQTGLFDSYAIELKFNVFDGRFDSPWTHQ